MLIDGIDLKSVFSLKPKYHQYDNLLENLSIVLNVDISKKIDINLRQSEMDMIIGWSSLMEKTILDFKQKIDYSEFEPNINYENNLENLENSGNVEWDDSQSYSTFSISKEYEFLNNKSTVGDADFITSYYHIESDRDISLCHRMKFPPIPHHLL